MTHSPTYHFDRTYRWNYDNGPDFSGAFPEIQKKNSIDLLGHTLHSPFGISAGILLNSRWIGVYARLGFDLLTYKTVRSAQRDCYPLPNWVFVNCPAPLQEEDDTPVIAHQRPQNEWPCLTSSVCFGMPSSSPAVWREDVSKAKSLLNYGQMLIVSVVGTPGENGNLTELARDYALCARWAVEAGADAVEANLSCPNVCTAEGAVYQSAEATRIIGEHIKEVIENQPLLLKISSLRDQNAYADFLQRTQSFADGIVLLNCVSRRVHNPDGTPAFGKGKERAGVLGWGTYDICFQHAKMMLRARQESGCRQAVIPVGGTTTTEAAHAYLQAGADAVLMGGAPVFDPYLAVKLKEQKRI